MNVATLGLQTLLGAQNRGFCLKVQELIPQLPLDIPTETPSSLKTMVTITPSLNLSPPCETRRSQGRRGRVDSDPFLFAPLASPNLAKSGPLTLLVMRRKPT